MVSAISAGETVQMMQVLAFPPSDGCSIRVSLESRNGMWALEGEGGGGKGREREGERDIQSERGIEM